MSKIKNASAKDKGRSLQKWACQKIADLTGYEWGMAGEDKPIESRGGGQPGADVRMEEAVREQFPFSVECKRQERWDVPGWIKQARANEAPDTDWLIIAKRSHQAPVVVMDAEAFFDLLQWWPPTDHGPRDIS